MCRFADGMKKILTLLCLVFVRDKLPAQVFPYCKAGLFAEYTYYSAISIEHDLDLVYGQNLDYLGNPTNLLLDIHYPNLLIDPLPARPMVVMLHGGGFLSGSKSDMTVYCEKLARAGYVAVSIDYRVGWDQVGAGGPCNGNIQQFRYAVYRAIQDVKAGIRFLIHHAADYRIDPQAIFLAGQSEGGMTAIHCTYLDQGEADNLLPGVSADLGSIDSAGNTFYEPFTVKGVFNWCGGSLDTLLIGPNNPIPLLSIHGLHDSVMPVEYGAYLNCQNANNPYPMVYGPKAIYSRMKNLGICTEANYDANGAHCFYPSLEEQVYIPAKFTCFFKNLLCGNCTTESKVSYNQKSCVEAAPVSVDDVADFALFTVFPNPASDAFFVSYAGQNELNIQVNLYDITGKKMAFFPGQTVGPGKRTALFKRPPTLSNGYYLLTMRWGNQSIFRSITFQ